jgi:protein-disulfide isomerase
MLKKAGREAMRTTGRKSAARRPSRQRISPLTWVVGVAIVLVVALIVLNASRSGRADRQGIVSSGAKSLGPADAPVVFTEFSNFTCPACKQFATDAGRQIVEQYAKAGKVRFEYKHFVFGGDEAWWAAEASECAAEQGKFWAYHDILFARQGGVGAFSKPALKRYASELNLDRAAFDACLDSDRTRGRVEADTQEAIRRGLQSTPTLFVNERKFVGAYPFSTLRDAIEQELRAREGG